MKLTRRDYTLIFGIIAVAAVAVAAVVLTAFNGDDNNLKITDHTEASLTFLDDIKSGRYTLCVEKFDNNMKASTPASVIEETWNEKVGKVGGFRFIQKTEIKTEGKYTATINYCKCGDTGVKIRQVYDKSGHIAGLWFDNYNPNDPPVLKEGLEEVTVTLNKGTAWELAGKLTKTKSVRSETVAVLVHGPDPSDMDETVSSVNKPFRDIAWGLAEMGVDTYRYDKRTFTHGTKFAALKDYTAEEETIQDAIAAAKILKTGGYKKAYVVGHNIGGMLAPRIVEESNGLFDGMVLLAGTSRNLTEVIKDQYDVMFKTMSEGTEKNITETWIDKEYAKVPKIDTWTDTELKNNTVFGISAHYLKDLKSKNPADVAKRIGVPMLVLQGTKDCQIYLDKDYEVWKVQMEGCSFVKLKTYNGLNHLFMLSQGPYAGTKSEYGIPAYVDGRVVADMAEFIIKG